MDALGGIHQWIWLFDRSASSDFKDVAAARFNLASDCYCFWDYYSVSVIKRNNGDVDRTRDCRVCLLSFVC